MVRLSYREHDRLESYFALGRMFGLRKFKTAPILRMKPGVIPLKFEILKEIKELKELIDFWNKEAACLHKEKNALSAFEAEHWVDYFSDKLDEIE